jgi:hypothetical protein
LTLTRDDPTCGWCRFKTKVTAQVQNIGNI